MKKKYFLFALVIICLISCNEENNLLLSEYQAIYGTWHLQYITWESSGIVVTKSLLCIAGYPVVNFFLSSLHRLLTSLRPDITDVGRPPPGSTHCPHM